MTKKMDDGAEQIAIAALGFIADDKELLARFLALSGIRAVDIRLAAQESGFWAGVLNFLCSNEIELLAFCARDGIEPEQVVAVLNRLPGGKNEEIL